ncbi:hypothetical protein PACTADRAFT_83806, partial [Pachysolen tannophilus NRRL Y-2460]
MNGPGYYELYRRSNAGTTLMDALDTLILDQRIQPQLAMRVLANFDKAVSDNLRDKAKSKLTFKGHLHTYRFCDDVWTFLIKDVNVKLDSSQTVNVDKFKIVACNSRRTGDS